MNIFALDIDPRQAAKWHCDNHVVEMTLQTAQMLSTINRMSGMHGSIYRETHKNHPCTRWARATTGNYKWLWRLGYYLCEENEHRFRKAHPSRHIIEMLEDSPVIVPKGRLSKFALCMPDRYKKNNPIEAYRLFYRAEKASGKLGTWKQNKPEWW